MSLAPERALQFLEKTFLAENDPVLWELAVLASGEARDEATPAFLKKLYHQETTVRARRIICLALATGRRTESLSWLVELVASEDDVRPALKALEIYQGNRQLWSEVEAHLESRALWERYRSGRLMARFQ